MVRYIRTANYVEYNANNRGSNVGDCVKRSISLAFDMPYTEVSKLLNAESKETGMDYTSPLTYYNVIAKLSGDKHHKWGRLKTDEQTTLSDFVDQRCQSGTWLIETGSKQGSYSTNHIVCVVDGTIYDSWDSSDEWVKMYYEVPIQSRKEFTDIASSIKTELAPIAEEMLLAETKKVAQRYATKKQAEWATVIDDIGVSTSVVGYQIKCTAKLKIGKRSYRNNVSNLGFRFVIVLHPNDTIDEAKQIIAATIKQRVYDRLWTLNKDQDDIRETYEAEQAQGGQVMLHTNGGARARSLFRSLPAWARASANYIDVQNPGRYSDSYEVYLTEQGTGNDLHFYAPTADILRQELDLYHSEGYLPGRDYELSGMFDW